MTRAPLALPLPSASLEGGELERLVARLEACVASAPQGEYAQVLCEATDVPSIKMTRFAVLAWAMDTGGRWDG